MSKTQIRYFFRRHVRRKKSLLPPKCAALRRAQGDSRVIFSEFRTIQRKSLARSFCRESPSGLFPTVSKTRFSGFFRLRFHRVSVTAQRGAANLPLTVWYTRYVRKRLRAGGLAAHTGSRLMLLGSPPDMVHDPALRETDSSTPFPEGRRYTTRPGAGIHPRYSGSRVTGHRYLPDYRGSSPRRNGFAYLLLYTMGMKISTVKFRGRARGRGNLCVF